MRAFAALHTFDGRRPFMAWLRRIVVNGALNVLRDRRRTLPLGDEQPAPPEPEPVAGAVAVAVAALSEDRRVAVCLRYGLDLTPTEIADALGVPVGTAKSRIARGLEDLRTLLEGIPR